MVIEANLIDFGFILLKATFWYLSNHESYMHRCIELARLASGNVAPNPMVGAVLVHQNKIIGEGFHKVYGGPHAEVNCIDSVPGKDKNLISDSQLYVSLEPCAHFGKTPPCADLIIRHNITNVFVGCRDPFIEVNGKGIEKLIASGVNVTSGILEKECKALNKRFFTFHTQHRPYIILKWAQTADLKIGNTGNNRLMITNDYTNRIVHKWRSEEAAIMAGTNTVMQDDPQLTNRLWNGNHPVRVIIDLDLRLPSSLKVFDGSVKTIIFNTLKHDEQDHITFYQVTRDVNLVHQMLNGLYQMKVLSVMIEGGARLIQSFIDEGCWDEARVITNPTLISQGPAISSPILNESKIQSEELKVENDIITTYIPA
ncbi:MAG TPA: bifunctional diaminohydroxyphosphoribosylaminopyrimidine deaminase/5-amino-6-(5-phosphoribosylamino)uracil reductase RibD [Flavitalea sp.]|nr:bifunctional diaminohydroxyphosphoribosylaminopyrimidine deaminase/5-amino-6-(5-phosphoribosylamino)uracil reductase RibD [Flavitalea sp.]